MNDQTPHLRDLLPIDRYLWTLDIVQREGKHLRYSWKTLFERQPPIDADWIGRLEDYPDDAIKLEAFVSRYGRMQDTLADKLIPRWLQSLAERTGSQLENLNRAERLGVIESTEEWLAARKLRNQLVHEYMEDSHAFMGALENAREHALMLISTYNNVRNYSRDNLNVDEHRLPPSL